MPNLTDLDVRWVSLVDRAAVRNAENPTEPQRFLLWKAETAGETNPDPVGGTMTEEELRAAVAKAETERDEAREATQKAQAEHAELTEALGAEVVAKARNWKKGDPPPWSKNGKGKTPDTKTNDHDEPDDAEEDNIAKADLPPAVRARLDKLEKAETDARERLAKAEEIAKAEREIRVTREYVAKAETFRALPVEAAKFGPVLKAAAEQLSAEDAAELDRVLKAADAQIAAGNLFGESGRGGEPQASGGGSEELVRKAAEIRKADPKLSEYQAMNQAMRQDRDAQARYLSDVR